MHTMTDLKLKLRWKAIASAMDSSLAGLCLLTGCTALVWLLCFPESMVAEWITIIACSVIFLCVVFAAITLKAPPRQSVLLSEIRGPWALYMLIVTAIKDPSPGWAYFIAILWVWAIVTLILRRLRNKAL